MNLLQHETEKYIFIYTCKFQRYRPRIMYATKDYACPAVIDAAVRRSNCRFSSEL